MKTTNTLSLFMSASVLIVAGTFLSIALGANSGIRSMSRRVGGPAYQQRMQKVLNLADAGHSALYHHDYARAVEDLQQSINLDGSGGNAGTWADLGRALDEQGRSEEAYAAYREAYDNPKRSGSSNFPHDVETLTHYGIMCENHGQHESAVRAYNKAVEELNPRQTSVALDVPADPQQTPAPHLRALLDVMQGLTIGEEKNVAGGQDKSDEALAAFQAAAWQEPNDARVNYYLGYGYQKAGNVKAAQIAFARAAHLDTEGTVKAAAMKELPGAVQPR